MLDGKQDEGVSVTENRHAIMMLICWVHSSLVSVLDQDSLCVQGSPLP